MIQPVKCIDETVLDEAPIELDNVVELTAAKKAAAPKQEEFAAIVAWVRAPINISQRLI